MFKQRRPSVSSGSALFAKINTLLVLVDYRIRIWSGTLHIKHQISGAHEEVIPTSSQILSKLYLERLILVLDYAHVLCT